MKLFLLSTFLFIIVNCIAQDSSQKKIDTSRLRFVMKLSPGTKVNVESSYPGGESGWNKFLKENMRYPDRAYAKGIEGVVVIRFMVDSSGVLSDVKVVSGPTYGGLRDEAVRLIRMSGNWNPAYQSEFTNQGEKKVFMKSYKTQAFVFRLH